MHDGNVDVNTTMVSLSRNVLNGKSFETQDRRNAWICEVYKSTWMVICHRLSRENGGIFLCSVRAINLCFSNWETRDTETM